MEKVEDECGSMPWNGSLVDIEITVLSRIFSFCVRFEWTVNQKLYIEATLFTRKTTKAAHSHENRRKLTNDLNSLQQKRLPIDEISIYDLFKKFFGFKTAAKNKVKYS